MFYTYNQNNSGGSFIEDADRGIAHYVIVEADSPEQADITAENIGLYFDDSYDCPCCGSRWDEASSYDESEVPTIYGREIVNGKVVPIEGSPYTDMNWMDGPEGYIHYADGRVESFDY